MPDFQEIYGLRLTQVVREWEPVEVALLIAGLPADSRYIARLQGYTDGKGWTDQDWLNLDVRNSVEALRVMNAKQGKNSSKVKFQEWEHHPGKKQRKRLETRAKFDGLKNSVKRAGGQLHL